MESQIRELLARLTDLIEGAEGLSAETPMIDGKGRPVISVIDLDTRTRVVLGVILPD